jgi:hypothetical protein
VSLLSDVLERRSLNSLFRQKKTAPLALGDYRTQFYRKYRQEAEEYDRDLVKKYSEDVHATLIFVSLISYFDGPALTLRRQAGLLSAVTAPFIVDLNSQLQVDSDNALDWAQFGFLISLTSSLLSAFIAMLRRPWLDNYGSVDRRLSVIEQSQNRQRKFDALATWGFGAVTFYPQYLLQVAVLAFGGGICCHLWDADTGFAPGIIFIVSIGLFLYGALIVMGAAFANCPYQSPGTSVFRRLSHLFRDVFASLTNGRLVGGLALTRKMRSKATAPMDIRCISWVFRWSSDDVVRLSAVEFLATIRTLDGFEPLLVAECLEVLIGCVDVADNDVAIVRGLEELAIASSVSFLRTLSHLSVMDPTSSILGDIRQRYISVFPLCADFHGHQFYHTIGAIHSALYPHDKHQHIQWSDYQPSDHEHTVVADAFTKLARSEYRITHEKVPRWILRFALHSLSQDPLPPDAVVVDCLSVVAIDLGIDVSDVGFTTSDER